MSQTFEEEKEQLIRTKTKWDIEKYFRESLKSTEKSNQVEKMKSNLESVLKKHNKYSNPKKKSEPEVHDTVDPPINSPPLKIHPRPPNPKNSLLIFERP